MHLRTHTQTHCEIYPVSRTVQSERVLPARLLHHFGAVVPAHLAERLVAIHDRIVDDLRVRQQEAAVCCGQYRRQSALATDPHRPGRGVGGGLRYSRCEEERRMMFSRKVFCGATSPRRPPGMPRLGPRVAAHLTARARAPSATDRHSTLHTNFPINN